MTSRDGDEERVVDHVNKRARTSATSERVESSIGLPFVAFLFLNLFSTLRSLTTHTLQPTNNTSQSTGEQRATSTTLCKELCCDCFCFSQPKKKKNVSDGHGINDPIGKL
jgi:hypothetical protein